MYARKKENNLKITMYGVGHRFEYGIIKRLELNLRK